MSTRTRTMMTSKNTTRYTIEKVDRVIDKKRARLVLEKALGKEV